MKILREALGLAMATAKQSEVSLWLVGDGGIITDVLIAAYGEHWERCVIPVGMHRYGKVITKYDPDPGPGCNFVLKGDSWRFVDECGDEVLVEVVGQPEEKS